MRARTANKGKAEAGLPLSDAFRAHQQAILEEQARNSDVSTVLNALSEGDPRSFLSGPSVSFSGNESNPLFHNTGKGFVEIGATLGASRIEDGRGFVLADLDQDGALDLVIRNYHRNPVVALLNRAAGGNRWLRVKLRGEKSNRFGIGARVTVNGQIQEMSCGTGFMSGNAPELHFGLGAAERADVRVRWPSGQVDEHKGVAANKVMTLREGGGIEAGTLSRVILSSTPRERPREPEPDARAMLKNLRTLAGAPAPVDSGAKPVVLMFFSVDCMSCQAELLRAEEAERRARAAGVRIVWVSTDESSSRVAEAFQREGIRVDPFRVGRGAGEVRVPCAYRISGDRVEKFYGRHALTAALSMAK